MRLIAVLILGFSISSASVSAQDNSTKITSEPPDVTVKIITNERTTHFDDIIEKYKRQGYPPESIEKARSGYDEIKRKYPSETITCITPCTVSIPLNTWNASTISAVKYGFPDYSAKLGSFSKSTDKSSPKLINLKFSLPESVPQSCIFNKDFNFIGSQEQMPCYRPQPKAPKSLRRKKYSYKCSVKFDLDFEGKTENINITDCPLKKLQELTVRSVQSWRYVPKTEEGKPVPAKGVVSSINYIYTDKRGNDFPFAN